MAEAGAAPKPRAGVEKAVAELKAFTTVWPVVLLKGNRHLRVEHWQCIAREMGYAGQVRSSNPVELANVRGWEAHAVVVDTASGIEIGGADGMCATDESRWKSAPQQQIRSMAQTRAESKAFRLLFGDIAIKAGFSATPAEELDDDDPVPGNGKVGQRISEAQRKKLFAVAHKAGHTDEGLLAFLKGKYAIEHTHDIPLAQYDGILARVTNPEVLAA